MNDLRWFQHMTTLVLLGFCVLIAGGLLASGNAALLSGLVAGVLLGWANLVWMVATARRFIGRQPTARMLQVTAAVRFLSIVALFGAVLILGHVHPVGAVIGYGCFPVAAAAAGWWMMRPPRQATA